MRWLQYHLEKTIRRTTDGGIDRGHEGARI
jgi:hypothetical protein